MTKKHSNELRGLGCVVSNPSLKRHRKLKRKLKKDLTVVIRRPIEHVACVYPGEVLKSCDKCH